MHLESYTIKSKAMLEASWVPRGGLINQTPDIVHLHTKKKKRPR